MRRILTALIAASAARLASAQPDLEAQFVFGPAQAAAGQGVFVTRAINNVGAPFVGSFTYRIRLSGAVVATVTSSSLGQDTDAISIPPGFAPGQYNWELDVDPAPGEINLANNLLVGGSCTITGPADLCVPDSSQITASSPPNSTTDPPPVERKLVNCSDQTALDWAGSLNPAVPWLSLSASSGTIAPLGETTLAIAFHAVGLPEGEYETTLVLANQHDPLDREEIPVQLHVGSTPFEPGQFLVGDLASEGDSKVALFEGIAGMKIKLEVQFDPGLTPRVTLVNPAGVDVKSWIIGKSGAKKKRKLKLAGTWKLRIEAVAGFGKFGIATGRTLPKKAKMKAKTAKVSLTKVKELKVLGLKGGTMDAAVLPLLGPADFSVEIVTPGFGIIDAGTFAVPSAPGAGLFIQAFPFEQSGLYRIRVRGQSETPVKAAVQVVPHQPPKGIGTVDLP